MSFPAVGFTAYLAILPARFFYWWFWQAPAKLIQILESLFKASLHMLSLGLLIKTFFKPLKNEYREGLVGISMFMGIVIKSLLIIFDLVFIVFFIGFEIVLFIAWILFPFSIIWGLYGAVFS
ncbi:MAG: hypothetical protein A2134_03180 [Candidatus Woykebacteria bacterium RBG_16_39_9b]|uniref:Uncharacterized protein n=1 Tax=Candidatus Woykebacteria bacterium RBG_16_39_9b TaxID=1802595 RepID=A0A1G1WCH2_9BACT|nr:MAG: hypothetical protein A2134_03180 [Candidatus Woykebacteria bacterium RBG_16_39_9b]